ncbi:glycosyltransferase [Pedobacter mucosus]|uniref:glycosyltransferase n=1 Tax=Pedobacter mucosus TaxID=2895286 RepID=UPI001EE3A703|nr:glycosyltransferase [Pedobacter mucosus]UKT62241.1 glycosyltransferase [Pedobacter mucosus]
MDKNILVFDTHPVQYRVPIWQTMEKESPGSVHVVYASDCSVQGRVDTEFGKSFAWDIPMLSGYSHSILNCTKGIPLEGWSSLTGKGVAEYISKNKPAAVLLTGLNYRFDLIAYFAAKRNNIPVWLRCETQDYALHRSKFKSIIRSVIYKAAYTFLDQVFFIGELNKTHYLKHNVKPELLKPARYCTDDKFSLMDLDKKRQIRNSARFFAKIDAHALVIGFSGKFIEKKNPDILFKMLKNLPPKVRSRVHLYFMGSGELQSSLEELAQNALQEYGIKTYFAGFVNQSQLVPHYLAMDIMVLPSRKMGETWGLVANEAMQAGCAVVVSDAVGCSKDFSTWERFRVFKEESAVDLAHTITDLAKYRRSFEWASEKLTTNYSIQATAASLLQQLKLVS